MRLRVQAPFTEERRTFALRFACEDCAYFDAEGERCSHGYPNAEHREAHVAETGASLVFCKEFELR